MQVEANGRTLHYVEEGAGQPLLLVHGTLNDYRLWASHLKPLGTRFRVIAYSRRDSYPNEWAGDGSDNTVFNNSQDLAALVENLGIAPIHLLGFSGGGALAVEFARQHPESLRSLILVEPALTSLIVNPTKPSSLLRLLLRHPVTAVTAIRNYTGGIKPAQKLIEQGDWEKGIRLFVDTAIGRKDAFETFPDWVRRMVWDNARSFLGEIRDLDSHVFTREDASRITVPTLLVKGGISPKPLRYIVDVLGESMPNCDVVQVPGASHNAIWAQPEAFDKLVLEFLGRSANR